MKRFGVISLIISLCLSIFTFFAIFSAPIEMNGSLGRTLVIPIYLLIALSFVITFLLAVISLIKKEIKIYAILSIILLLFTVIFIAFGMGLVIL